jgi:hypothetical protein
VGLDQPEQGSKSEKVEKAPRPRGRRIGLEVRVSWLLLGAALVGFGPVAALVVVASVKNADALSTVALALAIVAFAIQILVFVVQTQTASQQMIQSERLNTQTRELLVEVNTAVGSTQSMVGEQFRDLLRAFVEGASKTAAETGKFDPEQFEQRLMANIQQATQRPPQPEPVSAEAPRTATPARRVRRRAVDQKRERDELTTFPPDDEGREIAAAMRHLSDGARRRLVALGGDELNSRESGVYIGLSPEKAADDELVDLELVSRARVRQEDGLFEVTRLTAKGRQWARLLVATGEIPDYAADLTPPEPESASDDDIPF